MTTKTLDYKAMQVRGSRHFFSQVKEKGFSADDILSTLTAPVEVYPSGARYPGQWRMTGNGVCIVVKPEGNILNLITVYVDRVVTPVREDQLNTPQGRKFAAMGRGAR